MLEKLSLILKSSSKITVEPKDRQAKLSPLKYGPVAGRFFYFVMVMLNAKDIILMPRHTTSRFKHLIEVHPEAIPSIFWPYQCMSWDISTRINYLYNHFTTLPDLRYQIDCNANHPCTLAEVGDIYPGLSIIIDQNDLFMREGMITLNIFVCHERIFTIAFSVYKDEQRHICTIAGAIQGRRKAGITELYRDMTKKIYGIRPRDLMIEVFQIVCRLIGIDKIQGVTESHRQHRHRFYWLKDKQCQLSLNYDEVWLDRGGIRYNDAFYELPVTPLRKPLKGVIAKKRSMYRNRYALLARLEKEIELGLAAPGIRGRTGTHYYKTDMQFAG
jgi:uncharacterized protein VirK/YbjX